jgi:hypothetical protein
MSWDRPVHRYVLVKERLAQTNPNLLIQDMTLSKFLLLSFCWFRLYLQQLLTYFSDCYSRDLLHHEESNELHHFL